MGALLKLFVSLHFGYVDSLLLDFLFLGFTELNRSYAEGYLHNRGSVGLRPISVGNFLLPLETLLQTVQF